MNDTEKARLAALKMSAMQAMALTVLLARNGGSVTFSKAEYESIVARLGGRLSTVIHIEALAPKGGQVDEVRAMLVSKPPKQGDLPA